jgi:hypothetical protein
MRVILDGYNVINLWEDLKEEELYVARERLIRVMEDYQAYSGNRVTIVFDGASVNNEGVSEVEVMFSRPPKNADALIESIVHKAKHPASIMVVSSDLFLRNFVLGKGAICRHPLLFREEVISTLNRMRRRYIKDL